MTTLQTLLNISDTGAGYIVLLDPDKLTAADAVKTAAACEEAGADALFVGGSLIFGDHFDSWVREVKKAVSIPLILFPGNGYQVSSHADAILFMSLISGRNPQYLIGEQAVSAPRIKAAGMETISTGYMLIESGNMTSVGYMSNSQPIPRSKPDIAAAHALAAQYLGMSLIYLEAGSGAEQTVPEEMIHMVKKICSLPLVVGGGIVTPEEAARKVTAGASFIVTGTVHEGRFSADIIRDFSEAVHTASEGRQNR